MYQFECELVKDYFVNPNNITCNRCRKAIHPHQYCVIATELDNANMWIHTYCPFCGLQFAGQHGADKKELDYIRSLVGVAPSK